MVVLLGSTHTPGTTCAVCTCDMKSAPVVLDERTTTQSQRRSIYGGREDGGAHCPVNQNNRFSARPLGTHKRPDGGDISSPESKDGRERSARAHAGVMRYGPK